MALLFMDGFDAGDFAIKWSVVGTHSSSTTTRFSTGRSISSPALSGDTFSKNLTASSQVTVGFAMQVVSGTTSYAGIVIKGDAGATTHLTIIRSGTTGFLEVRRGSQIGTVLGTSTTSLALDSWHYIEVQATIADAGGIVKVRFDGSSTNEIDFTGDTKNAGTNTTIDQISFVNANSATLRVDDVYMLNSTGTSNTTFLGDVRVQTVVPTGNGTSSQLTGSDGNSTDNYLLVDELPYSAADYVGSGTATNRDTYVMGDVLAGTSAVYGLQTNLVAAKSDASAASVKSALLIGGTVYYGNTNALSTSYLTYVDMQNTNPNTSSAWTVGGVNGLEAGAEVV